MEDIEEKNIENKKFTGWILGISAVVVVVMMSWVGSSISSLTDSTIRLQETAKHSEKQIGKNSILIERASLVLAKVEFSCSNIGSDVMSHTKDIEMLNTAYYKGRRFTWEDGKELRVMYAEIIRKIENRLARLEAKRGDTL